MLVCTVGAAVQLYPLKPLCFVGGVLVSRFNERRRPSDALFEPHRAVRACNQLLRHHTYTFVAQSELVLGDEDRYREHSVVAHFAPSVVSADVDLNGVIAGSLRRLRQDQVRLRFVHVVLFDAEDVGGA